MTRLWGVVALLAAIASGCGSCASLSPSNNAPAEVLPRHLPDETFAGYPRSDAGLPILMSTTLDGVDLQLVYDETIDDPLEHWGECIDRVASCLATNGGQLGGCVDRIEICDAGAGRGCCPQACIDTYKSRRQTLDERDAIRASFYAGDCIEGFKDQMSVLDEGEVTP